MVRKTLARLGLESNPAPEIKLIIGVMLSRQQQHILTIFALRMVSCDQWQTGWKVVTIYWA